MMLWRNFGFYKGIANLPPIPIRLTLFVFTFSAKYGIAIVRHDDLKDSEEKD